MEMEGHLLICEGVSGNIRTKEKVGCTINEKHKRFIMKWIGGTERVFGVELKMKLNVTPFGSNDDKITRDEDDFREKLNFAIEDAKDKLIIIGGVSVQESGRETKRTVLWQETKENT